MAKKMAAFRLSDTSKKKLEIIAEHERRSQANALEILIDKEFDLRGLKLPEEPAKPKK